MINLGELGSGPSAVAHPAPRRLPLSRYRRWLLVAETAALLAVVAAAPAAAAPPLWLPQATDVVVGQGSLYTLTGSERGWLLTRYELPDGAVRWTGRLGHYGGPASVALADTVPVVATVRDGRVVSTAYDPETGRPWWRQPGWPGRVVGDRVLVHRPATLTAVDLRTGEIAWTIPVAGGELQMYGSPADLVVLRGDHLTRYDLVTGAALATAVVPGRQHYPAVGGGLPSALLGETRPAVADGLVMLSEPISEDTVAAYDLGTLTRRWSLPGYGWAAPCGPVVCAVAADLSRLVGVEPRTGVVRWVWDCRVQGSADQACYVLPSALGPADPLLVQQWELGPGGVDIAWLVDPSTGVSVAELGQWQPVGPIDASSWLLRWVDGDEPVFGNRAPPERSWLARLTLEPPYVHVLGAIESPPLPELVWLHARAGSGGRA